MADLLKSNNLHSIEFVDQGVAAVLKVVQSLGNHDLKSLQRAWSSILHPHTSSKTVICLLSHCSFFVLLGWRTRVTRLSSARRTNFETVR